MRRTLQDQYLLIKEGKGHKDVFIKEAKRQFPGLIRNAATYTEVANVLKTKNIINENVVGIEPINNITPSKKESYEVAFENFLAEAKKEYFDDEKAEVKKPSKQVEEDAEKNFDYEDKKNPDNLIFDQIMKGYYTEMKDPKNENKTMEQLKAIVIKNLEKNPTYYTEKGQFGVKDLGYTMDAPGLGEPKEPKGKYKSSGYGNLNENKEPINEEDQIRKVVRSIINEELEEILQINPVQGTGGRRKIPTNYLLPDSIISKLNLSNPGPNAPTYDESAQIPHIKVFSRDGEAVLAISDLMYIALKGVTRGRSTRAQNVAKATLQKIQDNFTEKDWPAVRALIKKFTIDRISEIPVKGKMRPYHMVSFPEGYSLKVVDDGVMIDLPPYKPEDLAESKIKEVIKESVEKELAEINKLAEYEVYESKLEKIAELIEKKCSRLNRLDEDEDLKALTDKKKVKELQRDIKKLEKAKAKLEKALAKKAKAAPKKKEVIDEDEPISEIASEDAEATSVAAGETADELERAAAAAKELDDALEEGYTEPSEEDLDDVEPDYEWLSDIKRGR